MDFKISVSRTGNNPIDVKYDIPKEEVFNVVFCLIDFLNGLLKSFRK